MPKIRVRVGDAEIEAEGSHEELRGLLADFRALVPKEKDAGPRSTTTTPAGKPARGGAGTPPPEVPTHAFSRADLDRIFKVSDKGLVSLLRPVPESSEDKDLDRIVLLIYGFVILMNQPEVRGSLLIAGMNASGFTYVKRIDRYVKPTTREVHKTGERKGSTYLLTNMGEERARELVAAMKK